MNKGLYQPTPPIRINSLLDGRYLVHEEIGAGGFAKVYRATQVDLGREVALKVLHANKHTRPSIALSFRYEASTNAQLQHPNIVTLYNHGELKTGQPYLVMELLKGRSLEDELNSNGPLSLERLLDLFIPCLDGLGKAHEGDIIHKDLKPSNLFITNSTDFIGETLVTLDYGIACAQGRSFTNKGEHQGTPKYMSPEYIRHEDISAATDIYQVGLILCEAFTGQHPVESNEPYLCMLAHCQANLNIPDAISDSPLGPIVARCLDLDPDQRYANGYELRDALCEVQQQLEEGQHTSSPSLSLAAAITASFTDGDVSSIQGSAQGRKLGVYMATIMIVALIASLGAFALRMNSTDRSEHLSEVHAAEAPSVAVQPGVSELRRIEQLVEHERWEEATQELEALAAKGHYSGTLRLLKERVDQEKLPKAYYDAGVAALKSGRYDEAVHLFDRLEDQKSQHYAKRMQREGLREKALAGVAAQNGEPLPQERPELELQAMP